MLKVIRACAIAAAIALPAALFAQQTMDNAAVLKLQSAGLSEDLIVTTINNSPGHYSMTTDDMISLKKAGITDKEMAAMMQKNAGVSSTPAAAPAANAHIVDEVGVYYNDKTGAWAPLMTEVVNFKTGGVLKSFATGGIVKGDINGHINGASAKTSVATPVTILIYTPEGTAPTEYQLLKLHANSDNREFRSITGGIVHASGGAVKDQVGFDAAKIATRTYTFTIPAGSGAGEYGILPPGANSSSNMASGGKIYTFHVTE